MLGDKQVADLTASFGAALGRRASCQKERGGFTLRADDGGKVSFTALPQAHSGNGPAILVTELNAGSIGGTALITAFTGSVRVGALAKAKIVVAGASVVAAFREPLVAVEFAISESGLTLSLN